MWGKTLFFKEIIDVDVQGGKGDTYLIIPLTQMSVHQGC